MTDSHPRSTSVAALGDAALAATSFDPDAPDELDTLGDPETYDPADYRWVPVRRRPRYDGWTEEKQRRFIEVLADTGLVSEAARAVGLSTTSAYKLRRAAYGAAFARAWDAARHHAGCMVEDVAFERALAGQETPVFNRHGEQVGRKLVYDHRLLMFLLTHLKPERYARLAGPDAATPPVDAALAELEPRLPAAPETMLDTETFEHELLCADIADGKLPFFLDETRKVPTEPRDDLSPAEREEFEATLAAAKWEAAHPPKFDDAAPPGPKPRSRKPRAAKPRAPKPRCPKPRWR